MTLREQQIANLLKALEIQCSGIKSDKTKKIINYIIDTEISNLQLDIALFPKKVTQKEYSFHK